MVARYGDKLGRSMSMHQGVATWYDPCSCEAEQRWQRVAEEGKADQHNSKQRQMAKPHYEAEDEVGDESGAR